MGDFAVTRKGDFWAIPKGDNHCGPQDKPHRFAFEVNITSSSLDAKGFVFDQMDIQAYMDNTIELTVSCENFAKRCALHFASKIPNCTGCRVKICPENGNNAEYALSQAELGRDTVFLPQARHARFIDQG